MDTADGTGIILCGGKSSRMGFNKALLSIGGRFVLKETASQLNQLFKEVVLVTDDTTPFLKHSEFEDCAIWVDHYPEQGPLGGIVTALEGISTPYAFVMACDMPQLSLAAVSQLAVRGGEAQVILYSSESKLETLFSYYHVSCLPVFKKQLHKNERQIRRCFSELEVKVCSSEGLSFPNVNTPEQLKYWKISANDQQKRR